MGAAVSLSCSFVVPPTGCSPQAADLPKSPSAAPYHKAPTLSPQAAAPPALLPYCGPPSLGCSSGLGCSCGSIRGLWPSGFIYCCSTGSSIAARGALLREVPMSLSWSARSFCSTPLLALPPKISHICCRTTLHSPGHTGEQTEPVIESQKSNG